MDMNGPPVEPGGSEEAEASDAASREDGTRRATGDLPVLDPAALPSTPREREGSIVGVVLAAGTSSRFEKANKLLAAVDGEPIVRRAATTLCASAVNRVVVIVGHEAGSVRRALYGLDVTCVENADYERGQSTSVRAGVRAARDRGATAVVIALGDMPAVDTATIDALVGAYRASTGDAIAAAFEGQRGNPVLFDSQHFDALCDVSGDRGGRTILLEGGTGKLVETGDPGVLVDIDTEADLDGYHGVR